ncbi:hypothetical protein PHYPSEUDO_005169 [Phytophthora pseudosyringae]|uniref:PX domain-containing protein n=1 Tax=Phytophthora pseudosyringae TaxID=221518 RepID=A0A8T1VQ41_9STRA|nr:hypothetical protein PHYPSEUDO_005169 [Phytophthora pseudosyringae]
MATTSWWLRYQGGRRRGAVLPFAGKGSRSAIPDGSHQHVANIPPPGRPQSAVSVIATLAAMAISSTASTCSTSIINFSSYYRKRAASVELPDTTAWLEHLQLDVRTVTRANATGTGSKVEFEVQASYAPPCCQDPELAWAVSRPFDAYRRFRKQLLHRLQAGHACPAECKWLYAVVKNHFPKPKLLAANSPRTAEARRQALTRVLRTLQASLVNRGNQGCNVLVHGVCREFATFVLGENAKLPDVAMALSGCGSDQSTRDSSASFLSNCSDDEDYSEEISPFDELYACRSGRGYCKSESGQ